MNHKISGLLLAAGFSKRMGQPKALLIQEDLPFAVVILEKIRAVCGSLVVIPHGHNYDELILRIIRSWN